LLVLHPRPADPFTGRFFAVGAQKSYDPQKLASAVCWRAGLFRHYSASGPGSVRSECTSGLLRHPRDPCC